MIGQRHLIDRRAVQRRDHTFWPDVAEQGDLAPLVLRDRPVGPAQQHAGLNADRQQFLDRVLGRLGLQLTRRRDIGQQRAMGEQGPFRPDLVAELPDRLQKRQALDIADRAADLAQHEILVAEVGRDELLNRVRHVRDDLHGGAQIVAAPFLGNHVRIDLARRDIVAAPCRHAGKAFVMAKVEVGFGTVVGDIDLAMLGRAHRAWIDIEIGVQLAQTDLVAARLQQRAKRRRCQTFAEGGDHAAGDEDEPRHGTRH